MEEFENRLRRLEELLREVVARLEKLERLLSPSEAREELKTVISLLGLGLAPASKVLESSRRALTALRRIRIVGLYDDITRAIVEVLAAHPEGLSVAELTRRIREVRGRASRRIIAERVRKLREKGVVEAVGAGRDRRIRLRCVGGED